MNNPIIETDLGQILSEIKQELKSINDRLNKLEVGQGRIEEKLNSQEKIAEEVKTSQKNQIWALIILAFTAVATLTGTLGKVVFFP
jgi:anti-sigma-K factor RskA